MTTETEQPAPDGTAADDGEISHAVCRVCFPEPATGDLALCGHVISTDKIYSETRCVVCREMVQPHIADHVSRGEFPS